MKFHHWDVVQLTSKVTGAMRQAAQLTSSFWLKFIPSGCMCSVSRPPCRTRRIGYQVARTWSLGWRLRAYECTREQQTRIRHPDNYLWPRLFPTHGGRRIGVARVGG